MYWMPCERRSGTAGSSSPSSIPAILSSSGGIDDPAHDLLLASNLSFRIIY